MPVVDVGRQRISYRQQGPVHGRAQAPLLLVHGAGASSSAFGEMIGPLGRTRWTVAVDLPGHGRSPAWDAAPEELLDRYVDVLAAFGETIGLGRFVVAGHSMGGAIALRLALRYGDRLAGVVPIATGAVLRVSDAVFQVIERSWDEFAELMAVTGYSPLSNARDVERWSRQIIGAPQDVTLADYRACHLHDVRDQLGAIALPTVVVSASDDRLTTPKLQQRLIEGIPSARLCTIARAGHNVIQERPPQVVEAIASLKARS